jgi:hypothetical protein
LAAVVYRSGLANYPPVVQRSRTIYRIPPRCRRLLAIIENLLLLPQLLLFELQLLQTLLPRLDLLLSLILLLLELLLLISLLLLLPLGGRLRQQRKATIHQKHQHQNQAGRHDLLLVQIPSLD